MVKERQQRQRQSAGIASGNRPPKHRHSASTVPPPDVERLPQPPPVRPASHQVRPPSYKTRLPHPSPQKGALAPNGPAPSGPAPNDPAADAQVNSTSRQQDLLRLEAIKVQILSKLGLTGKPNVTAVVPPDVVRVALNRTDSLAMYVDAPEDPPPTTTNAPELELDDFYGRTSEVIAFAEPGESSSHFLFLFLFKKEISCLVFSSLQTIVEMNLMTSVFCLMSSSL